MKQKLTSLVSGALGHVPQKGWQRWAAVQTCQVGEGLVQLFGWKTTRWVILARELLGVTRWPEIAELWDRHKHELSVCVTNLTNSCNAQQIQEL